MLSQNPFEGSNGDNHQPSSPPSSVVQAQDPCCVYQQASSKESRDVSNAHFKEAAMPSNPASHAIPPPETDSYGRKPLVKLSVAKPFKGREVLRPITYFPIYVEVLAKNDGRFTAPISLTGSHQRHIDMNIKRNAWSRGNSAAVERRYREVMELREMLQFQFPNIIIPPLPDKDSVNHIETYFNAEDQMAKQKCNVQLFLSEIAAMPEIVFFSEWVPPFFLESRQSFETGTLLRMRATLGELRVANKTIEQFRQRNCTFVEYTTNKLVKKSTKIVRLVASFVWGDVTDGDDAPGDYRDRDDTESDGQWLALPKDLQSDAKQWKGIADVLSHRQAFFKKASKSFETFLNSTNDCSGEQIKASTAMSEYEATLRKAECFSKLAEHYRNAASMMTDIAQKEQELVDKRYFNVCMRLRFEHNYIDSALNAIDHVLSMYRNLASDVYDLNDSFYLNNQRYAKAVSEGLMQDYTHRYRPYYVRRMHNLLTEQIVKPTLESVAIIEETTQNAVFIRSIKQSELTSYSGTV